MISNMRGPRRVNGVLFKLLRITRFFSERASSQHKTQSVSSWARIRAATLQSRGSMLGVCTLSAPLCEQLTSHHEKKYVCGTGSTVRPMKGKKTSTKEEKHQHSHQHSRVEGKIYSSFSEEKDSELFSQPVVDNEDYVYLRIRRPFSELVGGNSTKSGDYVGCVS